MTNFIPAEIGAAELALDVALSMLAEAGLMPPGERTDNLRDALIGLRERRQMSAVEAAAGARVHAVCEREIRGLLSERDALLADYRKLRAWVGAQPQAHAKDIRQMGRRLEGKDGKALQLWADLMGQFADSILDDCPER